jgi:pimeloyl-ACP methyl ester carboxylesterase
MNARTSMQVVGLLLVAVAAFEATKDAAAQAAAEHHQFVKAGPATLQVTIRGRGDPIVFIPSRGRGVHDFDDLSSRLVQAGYRAILPEPRGIGGSTGPIEGITYHDLASMSRQRLSPLSPSRLPLSGMRLATVSRGRWPRIIPAS